MLSLDGLQRTVARAVLARTDFGLSPIVAAGRADPYRRMRIYQNNTRASLTSTLMTVFPVTVRMVDERFFRYAANEFIRENPPAEPRLVRYGSSFPAFLRTFKGLEELPYVAETARLEWAIAEALDDASRPPVPIAALNGGVNSACACSIETPGFSRPKARTQRHRRSSSASHVGVICAFIIIGTNTWICRPTSTPSNPARATPTTE